MPKVRSDREKAGADVAVIVSRELPREVDGGRGLVRDVVVITPAQVPIVAELLRLQLEQVARHKLAQDAAAGPTERVMSYLASGPFAERLVSAFEAITEIEEDAAKERRAMERQLQRREKWAREVVRNLLAIVTDLDTAGARLPAVAQLPALPED